MKLSEFINEYDYQGDLSNGQIVKIWKNPSPNNVKKELNKLESKGDYLRGVMTHSGDFYVASSECSLHSILYSILSKYGVPAFYSVFVYKNNDAVVNTGTETVEEVIKNLDKGLGWNFYTAGVFE